MYDIDSRIFCFSFLVASQFLVIGGEDQKQNDVIDLANFRLTCTSPVFGELELERQFAMGGLINETPILCGGKTSNDDIFDTCIVYGHNKTLIKMKAARSGAASVILNDTTLWIMGGNTGSIKRFGFRRLRSTELITLDGATSIKVPALPKELSYSCAVKYNESTIYLIGGSSDDSKRQNNVWISNILLDAGSSSWTEGPSMNNGRGGHGCILFHHGKRSYIVVAGGDDSFKSVEILDLKTNRWVQGENSNFPYFATQIKSYFKVRRI